MSKTANITITVNGEYLENLKIQKRMIMQLVATGLMPAAFNSESEGILGMMDEMQDKAVEAGFPEDEVFDFPHNHPEGEEGHTKQFEKEVSEMTDLILKSAKKHPKK